MTSLGPFFGWGSRGGGSDRDWFSTDLWDPFSSGAGASRINRDDTASLAHTNVDWRETDTSHIFRADLPGVRKEEVKVQVEDDNILQISGERVKEEVDDNDKWHRVERRRGSFVRRFRLPENAELESIKCTLENGVLTVEVPKKQTEQAQKNVKYIDVA